MITQWHPRRESSAALVIHTHDDVLTIEAEGDCLLLSMRGGRMAFPLAELFKKLEIHPSVVADALCEAWR